MEYRELWNKLTIDPQKMEIIRKDWTEGKVPDLPFVIIDQQGLKQHIGDKLKGIDGERMTTTVVRAQYGDGKTNVLKYLSLYFESHPELNIHLLYCRADVDQTDIFIFLLRHLQNNSIKEHYFSAKWFLSVDERFSISDENNLLDFRSSNRNTHASP